MKILTIGGATQDVFIQYENPELLNLERDGGKHAFLILEEGKKIEVDRLTYHSGGGATNSAVSFRRLGFEVTSFFKVGNDKQGEFILQEMAREGVDTKHVPCSMEYATGTSFVIPSPSGDRTVLAYRGANAQLCYNEVPFAEIDSQDQLYITSLSGNSAALLLPITQRAKECGVPVAVNPGGSQFSSGAQMLKNSLQYIDILILNAAEATLFMHSLVQTDARLKSSLTANTQKVYESAPSLVRSLIAYGNISFSLAGFFQAILRRGPRIVVVTNGAEGVYAATVDGIYFHESLPVKIVNSVGAGDAFGSTFVASILRKKTVEQALLYSILNSTSVITHMGAKTGLLMEHEFAQRVRNYTLNIQRFGF